jgi:hypothetical protein
MHLLAAPTPPATIEAPEIEHAIVGAVLRFSADPCVLDGYVVAGVRAEHFFHTDYARIWQHAVALRARGIAPDPQLLHHNLGARLDGGPALLYGVGDGVPRPTPANIQEHARVLREIWGSRQACYLAAAFQAALRQNPAAIANGAMTTFTDQLQAMRVDLLGTGADGSSLFHTARELTSDTAITVDWVVEGYLARGAITELDATIKRGKTTLLRDQVRCITTGQAWLGFPTKQTRVVWLTEERPTTFLPGLQRAGLADSTDVIVLSYWEVVGRPWPAIVDLAVAEAAARDAGVLIIDTLAQFAGLRGDEENNAGAALSALASVQRAAATGLAIELTRHERKSGGEPGESARGSSAYGGAADIIVAYQKPEGQHPPTRRVLRALSRFPETPETLVVEKLSSHLREGVWGESFVALGSAADAVVQAAQDQIGQDLPADPDGALSVKELKDRHPTLSPGTLDRALAGMGAQRIGGGKRGDPFRYYKPEKVSSQTSISRWEERNESAEAESRRMTDPSRGLAFDPR